ncbi:hypothetical protein ACFQFC_40165 [Amorphoplanes digitatis]|uniref:Uncharacterized protein n=1 Tax=Actinoplanes digitatis TaxID=1868 RepID=A0A7W7HX35_9ACTN|nr:hypothetical protein [Actinoplanes digitatis]MBB4762391.1 hypothetical protein [Actinoplanes digitatis]
MELTLPTTPVTLPPGVAVRVPVALRNPSLAARDVRITVARGRASGWASVDPPTATLGPGATTTVEVVLRAPADQPPSASLVPFTVHAEDTTSGATAGFATGLLTVALPVPVTGDLTPRPGAAQTFDLRLGNDGGYPADLRISAKLDPPGGSAEARPEAARLEAGASLSVVLHARPARPLVGAPRPYAVIVSVYDGAAEDRRPLLTAVGTGTRRPRLPNWAAGTIAVLLALGATAAVAISGVRMPLPGRNRAAAPPSVAASAPVPAAPVGRPFVLVDVFPHRGADGGQAAAEAQRAKLAAAGMQVRLVDSLASDELADDGAGFWVLLHDGFASPGAAQDFCTQWRTVAPKCTVTP